MTGILLDENKNLQVRNASLLIGDNTMQSVELLIGAFTGEFKENPILGGNAKKIINGTPDPFWTGNIRKQLRICHINASVEFVNNNIEVSIKD